MEGTAERIERKHKNGMKWGKMRSSFMKHELRGAPGLPKPKIFKWKNESKNNQIVTLKHKKGSKRTRRKSCRLEIRGGGAKKTSRGNTGAERTRNRGGRILGSGVVGMGISALADP